MTPEAFAARIANTCDGDPERQLTALRKAAVMTFLDGKISDEDIAEVIMLMGAGEVIYPPDDGGGETTESEPEATDDAPRLRLVA